MLDCDFRSKADATDLPSSLLPLLRRVNPLCGVICRVSVSLMAGGEYRGVRQDRHLSEASSFQIDASRGRRMASSGRLARILQQ